MSEQSRRGKTLIPRPSWILRSCNTYSALAAAVVDARHCSQWTYISYSLQIGFDTRELCLSLYVTSCGWGTTNHKDGKPWQCLQVHSEITRPRMQDGIQRLCKATNRAPPHRGNGWNASVLIHACKVPRMYQVKSLNWDNINFSWIDKEIKKPSSHKNVIENLSLNPVSLAVKLLHRSIFVPFELYMTAKIWLQMNLTYHHKILPSKDKGCITLANRH